MTRATLAVMAALLVAAPATAQQLDVGGEVRPRLEVRDPVFGLPTDGGAGGTDVFTSMRARASLEATLRDGVRAFVQLQDVRVWGTESGTTDGSADALDLHQGWVELGDAEAGGWALKVGRQELSYGTQRLVGALNWAQQARSFDGARLRVRPTGSLALDAFAMTIGNADAGGPRDEALYGVYASMDGADAYFLYNGYDAPPTAPGGAVDLTDQYTAGGHVGTAGRRFRTRLSGAYQFGERDGADVSASFFGWEGTWLIDDGASLGLWYDWLSGDDDPLDGEIKVFDTLFATNHKFYGHMDLFLNIPAHTAGRGLQDLALKGAYALDEDVTLTADLHGFFLTARDGIDSGHIGEELDLGLGWAYAPGVSVTGGLSYFVAADAWSEVLGRADENQVWGYVMLDVTF